MVLIWKQLHREEDMKESVDKIIQLVMGGSLMKVRDAHYQKDFRKRLLWSIAISLQYCFNPILGEVGCGNSPHLLVSLNNSETLNTVTLFPAFNNISLETSMPILVFLTCPISRY